MAVKTLRKPERSSLGGTLFGFFAKAVAVFIALALPVLGVWISSSLAAYSNLRTGLVVLAGALLFPMLPLGWELYAAARLRASGTSSKRFLTFVDRLTLRTLALNALFLGILLASWPERSFLALSTRGDWMLDGRSTPRAESARQILLRSAGKLEWLYVASHKNPFDDEKAARVQNKPTVEERKVADTKTVDTPKTPEAPEAKKPEGWPYPSSLHPAVASMPASAEASIESVAHYLKEEEPDPMLRVKALHDYVVDRIAYDYPAYENYKRGIPIGAESADAEPVFRNKRGVCAGYARLLVALGAFTGDEIAYVVGNVRGDGFGVSGSPHAWNAAKIGGAWHLMDATWDRPGSTDRPDEKVYRTDYLFAPPDVFGMDHLPNEAEWQLRLPSMEKSEFFRQPMLSPSFRAKGLVLVSPDRAQVAAGGSIDIELKNPRKISLLPDVGLIGVGSRQPCEAVVDTASRIHCTFPSDGVYIVRFFSATEKAYTYGYDGQLEVNSHR